MPSPTDLHVEIFADRPLGDTSFLYVLARSEQEAVRFARARNLWVFDTHSQAASAFDVVPIWPDTKIFVVQVDVRVVRVEGRVRS